MTAAQLLQEACTSGIICVGNRELDTLHAQFGIDITPAAIFTPPSALNLKVWLKPESLLAFADGAPIDQWNDSSGNANHYTPENPAFRPLCRLNAVGESAAADFDGTDDTLRVGNSLGVTTAYTVFCVLKADAVLGDQTIMKIGETNGMSLSKIGGNRHIVHNGIALLQDAAITLNAEIWSAVRTAVPLARLFVNGVNQAITNSGSAMNDPTVDAISKLATNTAGVNQFAGLILEVLIWNIALPDTERQTVEAYLNGKFAH